MATMPLRWRCTSSYFFADYLAAEEMSTIWHELLEGEIYAGSSTARSLEVLQIDDRTRRVPLRVDRVRYVPGV